MPASRASPSAVRITPIAKRIHAKYSCLLRASRAIPRHIMYPVSSVHEPHDLTATHFGAFFFIYLFLLLFEPLTAPFPLAVRDSSV